MPRRYTNPILFATLFGGAAVYENYILSLMPYMWLRFSEASGTIATDSSGNGRDMTIANAGAYAQSGASADTGLALRYNGTTTSLSRSGEIRPTAFTYLWLVQPVTAGESNFGRFIDVTGSRFLLQFNGALSSIYAQANAATTNATATSSIGLAASQWSFLAATFDNSGDRKIKLYKSTGGDFAELSYSSQIAAVGTLAAASGTSLFVGNDPSNALTLNANLDEFISFHRVLTTEELNAIAQKANFS